MARRICFPIIASALLAVIAMHGAAGAGLRHRSKRALLSSRSSILSTAAKSPVSPGCTKDSSKEICGQMTIINSMPFDILATYFLSTDCSKNDRNTALIGEFQVFPSCEVQGLPSTGNGALYISAGATGIVQYTDYGKNRPFSNYVTFLPAGSAGAHTCVGDYESGLDSHVCCGQNGTVSEQGFSDPSALICPKEFPKCVGYVGGYSPSLNPAEFYGLCVNANGYTNQYGFNSVVVHWDSSGSNYAANFSTGSYGNQTSALLASSGASSCDEYFPQTKRPLFATIYSPSVSSCLSAGTNANQIICGTDPNVGPINACPTNLPPTESGFSHSFSPGDDASLTGNGIQAFMNLTYNPNDVPLIFSNYYGQWHFVGQELDSLSLDYGATWSKSEANAVSNAWTTGLKLQSQETGKIGFLGEGGALTMTQEVSETQAHTATTTLTSQQGGSESLDCTSLACDDGNLYQWALFGTANIGQRQGVRQCSFVCIPLSSHTIPACPLGFCGNKACSCCNAVWRNDDNTTAGNSLCPTESPNAVPK